MIDALIVGERDPEKLVDLALGRMRSKIPELTQALHLISLWSRSSGLVDQIFFQCATGNSENASRSASASRSMSATIGNWRSSMMVISSNRAPTCTWSGWAKIVRIAAATMSADA